MGPIPLQIEQLLLDTSNPRIGSAKSQRDALQKILNEQDVKLLVLADSITTKGLNPMDRLLVLRENKTSSQYIALEGNRRVATLKILANPSVLSGLEVKDPSRKKFERLAADFHRASLEPIAGFEMPSREEANPWLHLRHNGANGGEGIVDWSGIAASRFRGSEPAAQALEFVRIFGGLNEEQKQLVEGKGKFPITTLRRLLSTVSVRERIGVDVSDKQLSSGLPAEEVIKPLRQIVLDLAGGKSVSELKNKQQQIQYIESLDSNSKPDLSKKGTIRPIGTIAAGEFKAKPSRPVRANRSQDPSERKTLVPRGVRLNVSESRIAAIFKELKSLKLDDFPNAVAVLLRVFLEMSVDHYMKSKKMSTRYQSKGHWNDKKLSEKVKEVVEHIVSQGCNRKDFDPILRALHDKHSPLSIDLLHGYIHNRYVVPKSRELLAAWDEAFPFFDGVWQ